MAMTGTEPVSAENLSAALQAANLDREVLFAGRLRLCRQSTVRRRRYAA